MMRRLLVVLVVLAVVGFVFFWLVLRPRIATANIPSTIDIKSLLPDNWVLLPERTVNCDFDRDPAGEPERLIFYRYDYVTAQGPSLIGGAVFHTEVNRVPQDPGLQSPYRPAFIVPYKLLPDIYESKGQGYLGEDNVSVVTWPPPGDRGACRADEFTIFGYTGGLATRLSLFRWNSDLRRYDGVSYAAGQRLAVDNATDATARLTGFTTWDRFNDRTWLCQVRHFTRANPDTNLAFSEDAGSRTIDFCYGPPPDSAYPEGVVVRMLRYPGSPEPNDGISDGYFYDSAVRSGLPDGLTQFKAPAGGGPVRIITLRSQGIMGTSYPAQGHYRATPPAPGGDTWWQSDEQAEVQTVIDGPNGPQDWTWRLVAIANERTALDTHWRIVSVRPTRP